MMFFKKEIREKVYGMYLNSIDLQTIAVELNLTVTEVDEIIDYMNETKMI